MFRQLYFDKIVEQSSWSSLTHTSQFLILIYSVWIYIDIPIAYIVLESLYKKYHDVNHGWHSHCTGTQETVLI